ncbi:unnamed protein product [Fraxinus pennsylvanica]|uniref:H15 domain-containing protein n=1 Tax=Fraxinus pennsylvanica TaxID=56036 RepID=A0AAD2DL04_9LAMI|nr:unnamed protein product [Fraxinus pennsylvanica]
MIDALIIKAITLPSPLASPSTQDHSRLLQRRLEEPQPSFRLYLSKSLQLSMARFQEVILKLAETHPNAPLTAASKSILEGRLNQLLSQSHTPDHPPYAAMIGRALLELNEKLGSSEDSILKFIKKEYNNLPWAHSTLLKHHLGKLCESGDIVTRGQRYMLPGAIPSLNSSTGHKRKKRKKKWRLNWDWLRERYKPRKKRESKQKNQQKGDQYEMSEDHKESEGLENHASENAIYHEEKPKYNIRKSNDGFDPSLLSTELPSRMDFDERKYLEGNPQQQEDKAEDNCPKLSSQKPPGFKLASIEPLGRMEVDGHNYLKVAKQQQREGDVAEHNCPELSSRTPPGFKSIRVEPTSRMEFDENKYIEATKPQQQEGYKADDDCPELSSQRLFDKSIRIENSLHFGICSKDEFSAQECLIVTKKLHLLALRKLDSAEVTLKLTNKEQLMEHPATQEPVILGPLKDKSVGPRGLELVSTKEFCQSLRNRRLPEPKAAATTTRDMELLAFSDSEDQHSPELKLSNLESLRDQHKTPKKSTVVRDQRAKLRSNRKQHEREQVNLSKSDGKVGVVIC